MIKFFASNQSISLVLIPIFIGLHLLLDVYFPLIDYGVFEQKNLWDLNFLVLNQGVSKLLTLLLMSINAILLNFVFNSLVYFDRNTFLPSILYVLVMSLFPESLYFNEGLIGHFFFILAFNQVVSIQQNEDARGSAFLSGLFLALAATFIPLYIFFVGVITIVLFNIRPFILREHILPYFGFLLPFGWVFILQPEWYNKFLHAEDNLNVFAYNEHIYIAIIVVMLLLIFIGTRTMLKNRSKSSIRFKRISVVTLFSFFFLLAVELGVDSFYNSTSYVLGSVILLPFILPYAFLVGKHQWIPNLFFYLLILINIIKFFYS